MDYILWSFLLISVPVSFAVDFYLSFLARFRELNLVLWSTPKFYDYTILVPLWGNAGYLQNREFLDKYKDKILICTTPNESQEFYQSISDYRRLEIKPKFLSPFSILTESLKYVRTKYVFFLDSDSQLVQNPSRIVGMAKTKNFDLTSLEVVPINQSNIIEKLQAFEYKQAMQSRRVYTWLTSGAGMLWKTSKARKVMKYHSGFFYGGDIECGRLAKMLKMNIGHIKSPVLTIVPNTWSGWFKQRIKWQCGGFRHSIVNVTSIRTPFYFIYNSIIVYGLLGVRWWKAIEYPHLMPIMFVCYALFISIINYKVWRPYLLLRPLIASIQVMIVTPFGILKYVLHAIRYRNIGYIRLRKANNKRCIKSFNVQQSLKWLSRFV